MLLKERCESLVPTNQRGYAQRYYFAHKEAYIARARAWRKANPEKMLACQRNWREANPKKHAAYNSKWREANLEKCAEYARNRRACKLKAEGSFTAEEFQALCEKAGNRCLCCGSSGALTADHIVPLSRGGSNNIENIQPLCQSCNSKKSTKTVNYWFKEIDANPKAD